MSQQIFSNKLELLGVYICRRLVSRIEDKSRTMTGIELFGIAKILGVSIEELFKTENDIKTKRCSFFTEQLLESKYLTYATVPVDVTVVTPASSSAPAYTGNSLCLFIHCF